MEERLSWIIDRDWNICKDEEVYRKNRDFVHSLGLKSDSVGWCDYDLESTDADNILSQMKEYKDKNNLEVRGLRGTYYRTYPFEESEWYKLELKYLTVDYSGEQIGEILAYKIPRNTYYIWENSPYTMATVSDEFRIACLEEKFTGIDFKWVRDSGK